MMKLAREIWERFRSSPYALFVLGTAHFRVGEFEQSVRRLEEGPAAGDWEVKLLGQPVLAMAWHRLGRPDAARRWLGEAAATLDRLAASRYAHGGDVPQDGRGAHLEWPMSWWDVLEMELWYREAHLMIDGVAPPADPRLHVLRGRALMGLRWPEKAAAEYAAALELSPQDPQVRLESRRARAYVHIHRGDWSAAAAEFAAATALRPADMVLCAPSHSHVSRPVTPKRTGMLARRCWHASRAPPSP